MAFIGLVFSTVHGQDVFRTEKHVPISPAEPLLPANTFSAHLPSTNLLTLQQAIEQALNNNPKTREDWANIKVQAAAIGISYSAFFPTVSGSAQGARERATTEVKGFPQFNSDTTAYTNTESLSLSWVLYDFGGRNAALANAKDLFLAAEANHDSTLRDVFALVTKDYYRAQAAQDAMAVDIENEKTAQESLKVAKQRVDSGVSPISDELQANTAYYQTVVDLTQSEGDFRTAVGTLAADMGQRPDLPLSLPATELEVKPDSIFQSSVSVLIDLAVNQHPTVRQARAQLAAAEAKVRQVRAQGRPSLSLVAKTSRSDVPLNEEVGVSSFEGIESDSYVGAQISLPLFDGFSNDYQVRQAQAQVEVERNAVDEARRQVGLNVWVGYQALRTSTENLDNIAKLLKIAQDSYSASEARYQSGVGTMIERLSAQASLASAKLQWINALSNWKTSRLQLASKLGDMGTWWLNAPTRAP